MRYSRTIEQGMQPDSLGDWVRFEDYATLESRVEVAYETINNQLETITAQNKKLLNAREKLVDAIDSQIAAIRQIDSLIAAEKSGDIHENQ